MIFDTFLPELFAILGNLRQSLLELLPNLLGSVIILITGFLRVTGGKDACYLLGHFPHE
jgi:hypothetical protein